LTARRIKTPSAPPGFELPLAFGVLLPIAAFPLVFAILISFQHSNLAGFEWSFDLGAWRSVFATGRFEVVIRTLRIAVVVAMIATLLAVPASYALCGMSRTLRAVALALLVAPFFVDLTSRMFSLRLALSREGVVDFILSRFGVPPGAVSSLIFSEPGVLLGMLSAYACTAVFPIYLSMSLIQPNLLDAGRALGCDEWQLVRRVVWPLSLPGIGCGFLVCLLYCLGDFVVPSTLSGDSVTLLGSSIQSAVTSFRYPIVGVLTVILFGWTLGLVACGLLLRTLRARQLGV
jgi:spermidine/putrescine transport system permease protein